MGDTEWELDVNYIRSAEQSGGFGVWDVPRIGDNSLRLRGPDGRTVHLIYQVCGVRRVNRRGTRFQIEVETFPMPLIVRLLDETKRIPVEKVGDVVVPGLFRRRIRPSEMPEPDARRTDSQTLTTGGAHALSNKDLDDLRI